MRILFCGDAVVSSGFARATHAACDALHAAGHEVHVVGINYWGSPHNYPYPIYPAVDPTDGGHEQFGVGRTAVLAARLKPDVIVLLNDTWNIPAYADAIADAYIDPKSKDKKLEGKLPLMIGWLAIDSKNVDGKTCRYLDVAVPWTEFGKSELVRGGYLGKIEVCPLGVNSYHFQPVDRQEARKLLGLPADKFIVGVVGRNQPRKRLELTIDYFAEWTKRYAVDDAVLLLHVAPTGDKGVDIPSLVRYFGLTNKVILNRPHIGHGESIETMNLIYNALDIYFTTSQAEGWGLPALEAMACGIPCVVPDYAAFSSTEGGWIEPGCAIQVPCSQRVVTAPMNGLAYTLGGLPDRLATVFALNIMHKQEGKREVYGLAGQALASELTWAKSGERFREILETAAAQAQLLPQAGTKARSNASAVDAAVTTEV